MSMDNLVYGNQYFLANRMTLAIFIDFPFLFLCSVCSTYCTFVQTGNLMLDNVTVVIRAAGERTEKVCGRLVKQQVKSENVFLIREKPFIKAVEKNFQIGIAQDRPWTLAVDADILLKENAIAQLVANAEKLSHQILEKLYVYQGYVVCKVFGRPRTAGLHLYQTKYLEQAATFITKDQSIHRPESTTYQAMNKQGYFHYIETGIYALHDYEQYHRDMFRNGYFQSKKHFKYVEHLMSYWKKNAQRDEFKALLQGWMYGMLDTEKVQVDLDFFDRIVQSTFPNINILERQEFDDVKMKELSSFITGEIEQFQKYPLKRVVLPIDPLAIKSSLPTRVKLKAAHAFLKVGSYLKGL